MSQLLINKSHTTKSSKLKNLTFKKLTALTCLVGLTLTAMGGPVVNAQSYEQKIQQLNQQNAQAAQANQGLEAEEDNLQAAIASLQAKIAELENQINANQAKSEELKNKVAELEAEIARQRSILKSNIKEMYLADRMSTVEMIATSKDLSEYVDKQQYREEVSSKIKETMDRINALKAEMEAEKVRIEKLLADQQAMQGDLAAQRAETGRLLALNQDQQVAYDNQLRGNKARIADLRRQQAAENAKHFVAPVRKVSRPAAAATGGGGSATAVNGANYPWPNVPFPNTMVDPWGMYKRQCVSYTAWKVAASGRHMPYWGGRGNANRWDDNARAAGIPVDTKPRVGDVAVSNSGTYGHVMYVEAVHGDGTISISQYNAGWDGDYSEGRRTAAGLYFIHF